MFRIDTLLESFDSLDLIPEGTEIFELREKSNILAKADQQEKIINVELKKIYNDILNNVKIDESRVQNLIDRNNKSIELLSSINDNSLSIKNMIKDVKETGSLLLNLKNEIKGN